MKKLSILVAVAGLCIATLNTQAQGLYAGVAVGYGFPSQVQSFTSGSSTSGTSTTITSQSISLGSGMSVGVYGGYMLSKNVGLELGISDKFSSSTSSTASSTDTSSSFGFLTTRTSTDVYTAKGSLFRLTPGIRLQVGDGNLKVYSVTGLIIGFPSATLEDAGSGSDVTTNGSTTISSSSFTSDEITTYSGGMILGFHGAIGVLYNFNDMMGIFGEISGNFQNWAPSQALITTATVNGVDQLGSMTTNQKQTNFESSYTVTSTSNAPGNPAEQPKMYLPFSSWGITVGVHFNFGGSSN